MQRIFIIGINLTVAVLGLCGCGQTGPLYLPQPAPAKASLNPLESYALKTDGVDAGIGAKAKVSDAVSETVSDAVSTAGAIAANNV